MEFRSIEHTSGNTPRCEFFKGASQDADTVTRRECLRLRRRRRRESGPKKLRSRRASRRAARTTRRRQGFQTRKFRRFHARPALQKTLFSPRDLTEFFKHHTAAVLDERPAVKPSAPPQDALLKPKAQKLTTTESFNKGRASKSAKTQRPDIRRTFVCFRAPSPLPGGGSGKPLFLMQRLVKSSQSSLVFDAI